MHSIGIGIIARPAKLVGALLCNETRLHSQFKCDSLCRNQLNFKLRISLPISRGYNAQLFVEADTDSTLQLATKSQRERSAPRLALLSLWYSSQCVNSATRSPVPIHPRPSVVNWPRTSLVANSAYCDPPTIPAVRRAYLIRSTALLLAASWRPSR